MSPLSLYEYVPCLPDEHIHPSSFSQSCHERNFHLAFYSESCIKAGACGLHTACLQPACYRQTLPAVTHIMRKGPPSLEYPSENGTEPTKALEFLKNQLRCHVTETPEPAGQLLCPVLWPPGALTTAAPMLWALHTTPSRTPHPWSPAELLQGRTGATPLSALSPGLNPEHPDLHPLDLLA